MFPYKNLIGFLRSVSMATICYSGPIYTICSDIVAMPWTIINAKFREDPLSNKKVSLQGLELHRQVCMAAICYNCPI